MTRLDRYILAQLIGPFAFFCLIISGILWLNQALGIVRIVTENGQPAAIFIELSLLLLPKVLIAAIPLSGFAAAVFLTNRLYGEAELVVMMSAGRSYRQLAKPFLVFGGLCFCALFLVVHYIAPISQSKLLSRQDQIKREFITQIIQPGEFITSQDRFTFFFGFKEKNGHLNDVLIEEKVNSNLTVTYIANQGQVVKTNETTTLVLKSGSIQRHNTVSDAFSLVKFDSLAFDLTQMGKDFETRADGFTEFHSLKLQDELDTIAPDDPALGRAMSLYHDRHVKTLLALLFPVLGLSALLVGGYRRAGFTLRIVFGVLMMAGLDSFRGATKAWVNENPAIWSIQYASAALCVVLILALLWAAGNDLRRFMPKRRGGLT